MTAYSSASTVLCYLAIGRNAPLIDNALSSWDEALGFDWPALFFWVQSHPALQLILHCAYFSLFPQLIFIVIFLGFTGRYESLRNLIEILVITSLATIFLVGIFPAAGPWKFFSIDGQVNSEMLSHFEPLRDGSLRTVDLLHLQGLVAFPSYHTVLAILLTYAMWKTPLAYLFLILNGAMILSAPTEGGHYLVDILAGAVLVTGAIMFSVLRTRSAGYVSNLPLKRD